MPSDTPETQVDNLRIHTDAADRLREVVRVIAVKRGIKPTQSEALRLIADHYLNNVLNTEAQPA